VKKKKARSDASPKGIKQLNPTTTIPPVKSEPQTAFIHSCLDEAMLTPVQFRIYCHITRRGECFASADKIAQCCRISRDSVWPAVNILERRGMIEILHRAGRTTIYRSTPPSKWLKDNPAEKAGQVNPAESKGQEVTERRGHPVAESKGYHPAERKGHKVYPSKVSPPNGYPGKGPMPGAVKVFPREANLIIQQLDQQILEIKKDKANQVEQWHTDSQGNRLAMAPILSAQAVKDIADLKAQKERIATASVATLESYGTSSED
jgi:predicted DNA-binding transcriptional regulator